jgi:mitotic spindle assembly checkpoint protein MAD1
VCAVLLAAYSLSLSQDLEQKLCLQEQDAAVVKSMKSELMRMPRMERELKRLHEENTHLR